MGGLHYIIFSKQTTCCLLKNLQDVGQDGFQGDCMHSITVRTKDGDVFNGTKGRASFGWDLRAPRFYAIVLAGKALHTPLINDFCKAFVKGGKLQALQDCCPGLEATQFSQAQRPSRACCQQQIHNFINTHSGSGFRLQWVSLGSFMLLCLSSYLQLLSQSQKIFCMLTLFNELGDDMD